MIALFWRDVQLAFRAGGSFGLTLAFFLILVMFVPFALGSDLDLLAKIAPGILWIGAVLSCLLSLDRIFQLDYEDGSLDALATAPLPISGVVFAKAAAHYFTSGLPLTLAAAPLGYLLNLPSNVYLPLLTSLVVGTPALSFIGAFGAGITVGIKRGGLLLSLLVLPLYIPTLIFGAQTAQRAAIGLDPTTSLILGAAISLICAAIMPFVTGLVLRANLR